MILDLKTDKSDQKSLITHSPLPACAGAPSRREPTDFVHLFIFYIAFSTVWSAFDMMSKALCFWVPIVSLSLFSRKQGKQYKALSSVFVHRWRICRTFSLCFRRISVRWDIFRKRSYLWKALHYPCCRRKCKQAHIFSEWWCLRLQRSQRHPCWKAKSFFWFRWEEQFFRVHRCVWRCQ